jgi:hypothetical protein
MSFCDFLVPRKEVISEEGVEGIIDLANLSDATRNKIETRPRDFFDLTYPTSDIRRVVECLNRRFQKSSDVPGTFLFEGLKGSGKSHLLLLIYNLFRYPEVARAWLAENGLSCTLPSDSVVIVNKFTDASTYSIWELIFSQLTYTYRAKKPIPGPDDLQKALGSRNAILIFDELEQGIRVIDKASVRDQNIAFLQVLSELSNRWKQLTLFASVYSDREEPGSTLKRVRPVRVQFSDSGYEDRNNIVLHRLFENASEIDKDQVAPIVDSYVGLWQRHTEVDTENVKRKFLITYPFTPFMMDIMLKKIPACGGFQNVRGVLGFLANMVKLTYKTRDIITSADASLSDKETTIRLSDLDVGGDLIRRAKENIEELTEYDYADGVASSVLLSTLATTGTMPGISRDNLIQEVLTPDRDINCLEQTLAAFQKYASYFWFNLQESRYYFDLEENSEAKIEFASLKVSDELARDTLCKILREDVFREMASSVILAETVPTKEQLNQLDKRRPRYVLATRRLSQEERHNLYFGLDNRNLIILLEPKDDKFQLSSNKDLLKWSKRCIAAQNLAVGATESSKRSDYERILRGDKSNIIDSIKKAGLVFVRWEKYGENISDDIVDPEPIIGDCSKDKVLDTLNQDLFPVMVIQEHLGSRVSEIKDHTVKEIDAEYRATLGFPVPPLSSSVAKAIRELCREGMIGLQHVRGSFCGENPSLSETELLEAQITAPFEQTIQPQPCPRCGQRPCVCEGPKPKPCQKCGQYPCICEKPPVTCPRCGQAPCVCRAFETKTIRIPPQSNPNTLRQQTAFRLQGEGQFVATKIIYKIFYEKTNIGDISVLPASLRGSLSGQGDVTAEITITKSGEYTKSQIEQQIESLPNIPDADYSVDLDIRVMKEE